MLKNKSARSRGAVPAFPVALRFSRERTFAGCGALVRVGNFFTFKFWTALL
ncbi:MAG: hypothetical protein K6B46_06200 [Opitutales bacterium]|nr:hypothetical protein [Opitutales bacterium]